MVIYFIAVLAWLSQVVPAWFWISTLITAVHTVEESVDSIWESLGIPATLYFVFQAGVVALGWFAIVDSMLVWAFVLIRVTDCIGTHWVLRKPGLITSPLLLVDAAVVCFRLCI